MRPEGRGRGALSAKRLSGDARPYRLLKEGFDWLIALAAGLLTLPLVLILMLVIAARDPGCPLFLQERVGRGGAAIRVAKLRTMRLRSDELSASLTPEQAAEYRREYKLADDPRWIGYRPGGDNERCLGAVLRRTALDELPQLLYNVCLRRDMALVGLRPVLREELERYYSPEERRLLLSVKPGLTSLWKACAPGGATLRKRRAAAAGALLRGARERPARREDTPADAARTVRREALMEIRIVVAAHRPCRLPEGGIYVPMQVGAALRPDMGLARDDAGDNISERNPDFCELTGLYWMWRNAEFDALGLAHYRRLFVRRGIGSKWSRVLDRRDVERLLSSADALLPKKRRYWIETNYSQYAHAHRAADLDRTRRIVARRCPEYLAAFDAVMRRRSGHRFNMFIMRGELARRYCAWLFPILFELERELDAPGSSGSGRRALGAVGERLLDVWLEVNRPRCRDIPYAFMGRQNWPRKLWAFCARKLRAMGGARV